MRLFVAIELDKRVKDELVAAQTRLREFDRTVRWPRPEQMHLTLKFLGEVPDGDVPGVCEAAKRAAQRSAPFRFTLRGLGCFPPKGPARIVWAGIEAQGQGLQGCQQAVEDEMVSVGFLREGRAYSPHLTIGRVRQGHDTRPLRAALETSELQGPLQSPSELVLFESKLTPRGAIYTAVTSCRLGGT